MVYEQELKWKVRIKNLPDIPSTEKYTFCLYNKSITNDYKEIGRAYSTTKLDGLLCFTDQITIKFRFEEIHWVAFVVLHEGKKSILGYGESCLSNIVVGEDFYQVVLSPDIPFILCSMLGASPSTNASQGALTAYLDAMEVSNQDVRVFQFGLVRSKDEIMESLWGFEMYDLNNQLLYKSEKITYKKGYSWKPFHLEAAVTIQSIRVKRTKPAGIKEDWTLKVNNDSLKENAEFTVKPSTSLKLVRFVVLPGFYKAIHERIWDFRYTAAIDFTQSNGNPSDPTSLHYIHPENEMNPYQLVFHSVRKVK